ncbi:MAG: DEAD/DEAH box helicase [bacterium]
MKKKGGKCKANFCKTRGKRKEERKTMFNYDPFQKTAIDYIENNNSVLISAPTGAGKTIIAEYVIKKCLQNKEGVIYTAPVKALSNQKFRDFRSQYGDKVGILTGDVSINPNAPVMIMTTEIFRNKLLSEKSSLDNYRWIIFDEIHYIDNEERGTVWEESIIFLPEHMKILALSATIPNINELAEWIRHIHKLQLKVVVENNRSVPLHIFYQAQGDIANSLDEVKKLAYTGEHYYSHHGRQYSTKSFRPNRVPDLVKHLHAANGLPCIYFAFGRRRCEALAESLAGRNFLSDGEEKGVIEFYNSLCKKFNLLSEPGAELLRPLISRGIAYHHAGMLPTLKEVVERLFTIRSIKIIFTTETFALGINMPARSVIFDGLQKFDGTGFRIMKARDFQQMAGRAGRRGIDDKGFVYCRINPLEVAFDKITHVVEGKTEKVVSQFNTAYATILNLYKDLGEGLYEIYERSFHYFQNDFIRRRTAVIQIKNRLSLLKDMGYVRKNSLTKKGLFVSQMFGHELVFGELYEKGFLDRMDKYELGILLLSLVYEPRRGLPKRIIPTKYKRLEKFVSAQEKGIKIKEAKYGIRTFIKKSSFQMSEAFDFWMHGEEFGEVLRFTDADEGEVVRYFRMALQLLKEIKSNQWTSIQLKQNAHKAIENICRGIVDAETQLKVE